MVILALVASGASIALILHMIATQRRDKRNIVPEEKIRERRDDAPSVVEREASPESQESVRVQPQPEVPPVEVENEAADATKARQFPPEKVESAPSAEITQPETEPIKAETTKFPEVNSHPEVKPATAVEMKEATEGTESPKPADEAEDIGAGTTGPALAGVEDGSQTKETKLREKRKPISLEKRGPSREADPKHREERARKRRVQTPKPEIVCWKREREWILAVELPEDFSENQNVTVVQDGTPLNADDTEDGCWRLSQLHGEVVVRVLDAENESLFKIALGEEGDLVFKLSGGDHGRRVKRVSCGSCLVIAPATWKRDEKKAGTARTNPEPVYLDGYQAHFFDLVGNEASQIAFRDEAGREVVTGASGPQFQLVGQEVPDASESFGSLFGGEPPRMCVADGAWENVRTIVLGEEGRGTGKKWHKAFSPDSALTEQEMPADILEKKAGWYFVRFYDLQDELIDSLDFRYCAGLRQITLQHGQPFPTATGHELATVEFAHDADWCVAPLSATPQDVKIEHTAVRTVLKIPPLPDCDLTGWVLGPRGGPQVEVTLLVERVWWAVTTVDKPPLQWRDSCLVLSAGDFTATPEKSIWLRLPKSRWTEDVLVGFRPEKRRKYPLNVTERALAIPLRDFSDAAELAERTKDCALKVWAYGNGVFHEAVVAVIPAETPGATLDIARIPACHLAKTLTLLHAMTHGPQRQLVKEARRRYRRPPNSAAGYNVEFVKESLCVVALLHLEDNRQSLAPKAAGRWRSKARLAGREFPDTMRQVWKRYRELEGRHNSGHFV